MVFSNYSYTGIFVHQHLPCLLIPVSASHTSFLTQLSSRHVPGDGNKENQTEPDGQEAEKNQL